ncbi:MAG: M48 family metallopeptidase, partial [Rickettsiales bacterium]
SGLLLALFPLLLIILFAAIIYAAAAIDNQGVAGSIPPFEFTQSIVKQYWLVFVGIAGGWFLISFLLHQNIINSVTGAKPLQRADNPEIYNLLENLCISRGLQTPDLYIIDDYALNAYASGISKSSFAITLTKGIIEELNKQELEAVLAHELSHIINRDVRLLVISLVFVGMLSTMCDLVWHSLRHGRGLRIGGGRSGGKDSGKAIIIVLAAAAILSIGYLFSILLRFALSRRREYLADAGAVELTKNPEALISALDKISGRANLNDVPSEYKEMMIENPRVGFMDMFGTHPPIEKRIEALKNTLGGSTSTDTKIAVNPWEPTEVLSEIKSKQDF